MNSVFESEAFLSLVSEAKREEGVMKIVLEVCEPIILNKAFSFYIVNRSDDDLIYLAYASAIKGIREVNLYKDKSFLEYLDKCMTNAFYCEIEKAAMEEKRTFENEKMVEEYLYFLQQNFSTDDEEIRKKVVESFNRALERLESRELQASEEEKLVITCIKRLFQVKIHNNTENN